MVKKFSLATLGLLIGCLSATAGTKAELAAKIAKGECTSFAHGPYTVDTAASSKLGTSIVFGGLYCGVPDDAIFSGIPLQGSGNTTTLKEWEHSLPSSPVAVMAGVETTKPEWTAIPDTKLKCKYTETPPWAVYVKLPVELQTAEKKWDQYCAGTVSCAGEGSDELPSLFACPSAFISKTPKGGDQLHCPSVSKCYEDMNRLGIKVRKVEMKKAEGPSFASTMKTAAVNQPLTPSKVRDEVMSEGARRTTDGNVVGSSAPMGESSDGKVHSSASRTPQSFTSVRYQ